MKNLLVIFFILVADFSFSQSFLIKGKIIDGKYFLPCVGVSVGFDTLTNTITDSYGNFSFRCDTNQINDTLIIFANTYYELYIINLPQDPVVDLGTIPIFQYYYDIPLVNFDCRRFDFLCNCRRKKFWKDYHRKRDNFYKEANAAISYYRLTYNLNDYSINVKNHILNMRKGN